MLCLGHLITDGNQEDKYEVIHRKNKQGQSLLELVIYQRESLLVPQHMILSIERELHGDYYSLCRCFRDNLKLQTSGELHKILYFMKETLPKTETTKLFTNIVIFFDIFLIPFVVMIADIVTDMLVVVNYGYMAFMGLCETPLLHVSNIPPEVEVHAAYA